MAAHISLLALVKYGHTLFMEQLTSKPASWEETAYLQNLLAILQSLNIIGCIIAKLWKIFYQQSEREWALVVIHHTYDIHV